MSLGLENLGPSYPNHCSRDLTCNVPGAVGLCVEVQDPRQNIGLFFWRAFPAEHIMAISMKPFFRLDGIRESLGIHSRRHWWNHFSGPDVLTHRSWIGGVAAGTRPITPVFDRKKFSATA